MTIEEKIAMLEEIMDVDEGSLKEIDELNDIEEWDSLSVLTLISEMKRKYSISLTSEDIKSFVTVGDICKRIPD